MTQLFYFLIFLYGVIIGSFLNVCICRIPKGESIFIKRSHCVSCGCQLKWYDLVPVISYCFLRGRCRKCGTRISCQYPLVEGANGILWMTVFGFCGIRMESVVYCLLASALLVLSIIDWRTYEIPVGINWFILVLGIIRAAMDYRNLPSYLIGMVCVSGFLYVIYVLTKGRGIGGGDIKLMAAAGLVLGWQLILLSLVIGCILGSVIHLIRMKASQAGHVLAMGPYLAVGIYLSLLFGNQWIQWYVQYCFG